MAYTYGNAAGSEALHTALAAFIENDAGWTLADDITSKDKVFTSNGEDGKCNNVMRLLFDDAQAGIKGLDDPHNAISWVQMLGSHGWDSGTHTPIRSFSTLGPWLVTNYNNQYAYFWQRDALSPQASGWTRSINQTYAALLRTDGRARFLCYAQGSVAEHGILSEAFGTTIKPMSAYSSGCPSGVWVYDSNTDTDYFYVLQTGGAPYWSKYDLKTGGVSNLASPNTIPTSVATSCQVWDGGDYIYSIHVDVGTQWERYSISGNSWTYMTALPAATSYYSPPAPSMHFIPAGVCGSWAEDVILIPRKNSTSTIFVWGLGGTPGWRTSVNLPESISYSVGFGLQVDRQAQKVYYINANSFQVQVGSCAAAWPTVWSGYTTQDVGGIQGVALIPMTWPTCRIRGHASDTIGYWFVGNKDRVIVVTKVKTNYYWAYFGKYTSAIKPLQMITTAPATAGSPVTVAVDSSTSFVAGESVNVVDPATGTWEKTTITSVTPTSVILPLTNNYGSGSFISADWPLVACSDSLLGTLPVSTAGYRTNYQTDFCRLRPLVDTTLAPSTITGRGQYQLGPVGLAQNQGATTAELKGQLDGVFSVPQGALTSEDLIVVGGKNFLFIHDNEADAFDARQYVIGPLE
jgi:hypothetical protein